MSQWIVFQPVTQPSAAMRWKYFDAKEDLPSFTQLSTTAVYETSVGNTEEERICSNQKIASSASAAGHVDS